MNQMKLVIGKSMTIFLIIILPLFLSACDKKAEILNQTARLIFILGKVSIDDSPGKIG